MTELSNDNELVEEKPKTTSPVRTRSLLVIATCIDSLFLIVLLRFVCALAIMYVNAPTMLDPDYFAVAMLILDVLIVAISFKVGTYLAVRFTHSRVAILQSDVLSLITYIQIAPLAAIGFLLLFTIGEARDFLPVMIAYVIGLWIVASIVTYKTSQRELARVAL